MRMRLPRPQYRARGSLLRLRAPITLSALAITGLLTAASAIHAGGGNHIPQATPRANLSQPKPQPVGLVTDDTPTPLSHYGLAEPLSPPDDAFAAGLTLQNISGIGDLFGVLDIPQIALAAYRNAELVLANEDPGCGLSWSLLAGIGKIESGHADGGRTDAAGTTLSPILGPALDGHLPGNAVLRSYDGSYLRAEGPMQFLPGTWAEYASDALGNGRPDVNNVFDATLAAGRYLCSGGLNLRDPAQELAAVLRYNNSAGYAAEVLSWAVAYRTGVDPSRVTPAIIAGMKAGKTPAPNTIPAPPATDVPPPPPAPPAPTQPMIVIPGLPPIPCGIFCPPAAPAIAPPPVTPPPGLVGPGPVIPGKPGPHPAGNAAPGRRAPGPHAKPNPKPAAGYPTMVW